MYQDEPIDVVITWVDGQDPVHQQKRSAYCARHGLVLSHVAPSTRFNTSGELDYCVRSLLYFAPWIRTIYIVTDAQVPPLLQRAAWAKRICLIDHRDIFAGFEQFLPTFNSISIETLLWRIPTLSNRFIYFNDDCVLLQPVRPQDFFGQDSQLVLRGTWKKLNSLNVRRVFKHRLKHGWNQQGSEIDVHRDVQKNAARHLQFAKRYFDLQHAPHPMRVDWFQALVTRAPEWVEGNIKHALRSPQQYLPASWIAHWAIAHNQAVFDSRLRVLMVHAGEHNSWRISRRLIAADTDARFAFACIQSLDQASCEVKQRLLAWLDKRIPGWDVLVNQAV